MFVSSCSSSRFLLCVTQSYVVKQWVHDWCLHYGWYLMNMKWPSNASYAIILSPPFHFAQMTDTCFILGANSIFLLNFLWNRLGSDTSRRHSTICWEHDPFDAVG
jgi:hypothetical protein